MPDKYSNYQELARFEREGVDFTIRQAVGNTTSALVLGLHAGRIEPGISEIVLAVAGDELSYYLFEGIKTHGNKDLHITSTHFDESDCLTLVQNSENVVVIHGERGNDKAVYVGGLDEQLKEHLMTALTDFETVFATRGCSESEKYPRHSRGYLLRLVQPYASSPPQYPSPAAHNMQRP